MSLSKADHIITSLTEKDPFFSDSRLACWEKEQGALTIYIFTQVINDEAELLKDYRKLRDHVAISFQAQAGITGAERWNLYLVYLVSGLVSTPTKQLIEQDKFSTRKIICSNFDSGSTEEQIAKLLDTELFEFDFKPKATPGSSLEQLIAEKHPAVHQSLSKLGSANTYEAIDTLLKLLK